MFLTKDKTMKDLTMFKFEQNEVRVINDENGEPWFIAKDVCEILDQPDTSKVCSRLDDDEKLTRTLCVSGQNREVLLISESGLYSLILTSRKPEAKKFKKWVTSEVLPSIRKTGGYLLPITFPEALRMLADKTESEEALKAQIESDKPAVAFAHIVTDSTNARCIRVWVKTMKHENNLIVGEREVFKWLVDNNYIFRDGGGYLPYSRYESNGSNYFTMTIDDINGKPRRVLKITGKGVVALTGKVVAAFAQKRNGLVSMQ